MSSRSSQPGRQSKASRPSDDAYTYPVAKPPAASPHRLVDALADRGLPAQKRPQPPTKQNALFKGVFTFPWYLSSLGCWLGTSCGLCFSFLVVVFALSQGFSVGAAVRPLGQCAGMSLILTMGFCVAHCRSIVEETAYGADAVENWPPFDWRGWVMTFGFALVMLAEAAAIAYVIAIPKLVGSVLPTVAITFGLFPIFLLSGIENGSLVPVSMPVLRTFKTLWWAWWVFYMETGVLLGLWAAVALGGLFVQPYLSVFVSAPLLAAVLMIYARLLGRIAWLASQEEPDDDE